jgi:hypothetical protein
MMWLEAGWRWLFLLVALLLLAVVATGVSAWRHLDDDEGLPPLPDEDQAVAWMHTDLPAPAGETPGQYQQGATSRGGEPKPRTRKPRHKPTGQWEWSDLLGRWFLDVLPGCDDHGPGCWLLHATGLTT